LTRNHKLKDKRLPAICANIVTLLQLVIDDDGGGGGGSKNDYDFVTVDYRSYTCLCGT